MGETGMDRGNLSFVLLFAMDNVLFDNAVIGSLQLAKWYAREHLLLLGLLGLLFGRAKLFLSNWVSAAASGNSLRANLFASFAGASRYFATSPEKAFFSGAD